MHVVCFHVCVWSFSLIFHLYSRTSFLQENFFFVNFGSKGLILKHFEIGAVLRQNAENLPKNGCTVILWGHGACQCMSSGSAGFLPPTGQDFYCKCQTLRQGGIANGRSRSTDMRTYAYLDAHTHTHHLALSFLKIICQQLWCPCSLSLITVCDPWLSCFL